MLSLGAFGSVVSDAAAVELESQAAQTLGGYGIDPSLLGLVGPAPEPAPQTSPSANVAAEDREAPPATGIGAMLAQYWKPIAIGAAVLVAVFFLAKKRKK